MMVNLKTKLKQSMLEGAQKYLSSEMQEELGINYNRSESSAKELDFNSFWSPAQSSSPLSNQETKKIAKWAIGLTLTAALLLILLLFNLIAPNSKSFRTNNDTTVVMNGVEIIEAEESFKTEKSESTAIDLIEDELDEQIIDEQIAVKNINLNDSKAAAKDLTVKSPLLKPEAAGSIVDYRVSNGDTLEVIAKKFYGSSEYKLVQKIKVANKIRNPRSLQIGQKLIIPF